MAADVDKRRLQGRLGKVSAQDMEKVAAAVSLHLLGDTSCRKQKSCFSLEKTRLKQLCIYMSDLLSLTVVFGISSACLKASI
ncbi:MAG: hypothetical protein IJS50_04720 [Desulfovibrio sp.]|nr:hypothetical protein [Desulfovibrio sp.]